LDGLYAQLTSESLDVTLSPSKPVQPVISHTEADGWLERLVELEEKLAQDLARKPGHQKPALQQQWRHEIAALSVRLDME